MYVYHQVVCTVLKTFVKLKEISSINTFNNQQHT